MPTIYIDQPDEKERQEALSSLLASLVKLFPGQVEARPALAVVTERPQVLALLEAFSSAAPAASQPAKAYTTAPLYKVGEKPNGQGG